MLLHCAAGVHRTGTVTYSMLRMTGMTEKDAYACVASMRKETGTGVGDWRIELAEKHIVNWLIILQIYTHLSISKSLTLKLL